MAKAQFDTLPSHKLAYLTMRKSGCTSIKQALAELRGVQKSDRKSNEIHGPHDALIMAEELKNPDDWFSFTIVREPITRFLSFYCNKILDQNINGNPTLMDRRKYGYLPNMPLDLAIDSLVNLDFETEPHAVPQFDVVKQSGIELNHVGHLENLQQSVELIREKTGVDLALGHLNQRRSTQPLITKEQFNRLADFYKNDFETFGYPATFEDWHSKYVAPNPEQFHSEQGFGFSDEAKLLNYGVERTDRRYVVDLHWRVDPAQSRIRYFRVVRNSGKPQRQVLFYLKANRELGSELDANGEIHERLAFQFNRIPDEYQDDDLYFQVYFWSEKLQSSQIIGSRGNNKLLLALPSVQDIESKVVAAKYQHVNS